MHYRVPANWFSGIDPVIEAHVLVGPNRALLFCVCDPDSDPMSIAQVAEAEAQGLI
ncbi:MAG: hypothetical protein U5L06_02635 [Rhodovibrio sp.]|nr:hypothetical protein [Rhodovibrio sp.]